MKLLAINTAFMQADLAFANEQNIITEQIDSNCKHSEVVMSQIDKMLGGTKIKDLDSMAVVVGTGSFTGIRISCAIAEGFKTANPKLNLVSINSFELASNCIQSLPEKKYAIVFNALGGRYFVQYFLKKVPQSDFLLLQKEEIEDVIKYGLKSEDLAFCDQYFEFSPNALCSLALKKANQNDFTEFLQPLYIRKSQAEEQLDKKNEN